MIKAIWYISKYCTILNADSPGSRGWLLVKAFRDKGYQSAIITSDFDDNSNLSNTYSNVPSFYKSGVIVVILKTLKFSTAKSLRRIISWFHFEFILFCLDKKFLPKPDVIIVSSLSILTILNGIFLKKKYKCKLVFEVRDIWPLTLLEIGRYSIYNPFIFLLQLVEILGYKNSDVIVGTMPNLVEHVKKVLGYSKPVQCIPQGVSENILNNSGGVIPAYIKKHLKSDYFNIIYTGTIGFTNALDTFFNAAELLTKYSKIRFIIVGDGPLRKNYIKKYGHLPNLIYFPKVTKNQIQFFLAYADVTYFSVFKSKVYDYGQSANKIIDYMIAAKPILVSYSGYPSMINEADCGYFIPAEDPHSLVSKIIEMSKMKESELNAMGARGLKWLKENRMYKNLANDYLRLLF